MFNNRWTKHEYQWTSWTNAILAKQKRLQTVGELTFYTLLANSRHDLISIAVDQNFYERYISFYDMWSLFFLTILTLILFCSLLSDKNDYECMLIKFVKAFQTEQSCSARITHTCGESQVERSTFNGF